MIVFLCTVGFLISELPIPPFAAEVYGVCGSQGSLPICGILSLYSVVPPLKSSLSAGGGIFIWKDFEVIHHRVKLALLLFFEVQRKINCLFPWC